MSEQQQYLATVIATAKQAGQAIMQVYAGQINVETKTDSSPVTQADLAAHHCIEARLKALTPDIPMLSEESANIPYEVRSNWSEYWLVDPLDGTKEFIKRNGEFTVNIALIQGHHAVLGVVYAPALDLLYYADAKGAYKQVGNLAATPIRTRPLNPQDIVIAASRSHADERLQHFVDKIEKKLSPPKLIPTGSSLKICMVAEGAADVYPRWGLTSEWDTAAAQCVLEMAGGRLTALHDGQLCYNSKESMLNPEFFASASSHDWQQYLH